jgi:hypothetical protein
MLFCADDLLNKIKEVDNISCEMDEIVNGIIGKQCKELDEYIIYVKKIVDDTETPISTAELEDVILTIPSLLYFMGSVQESLGIREDVATFDKKEKYSRIIQTCDGTVQTKTATADIQTQNENLTMIIYQRAKKQLQAKYDIALELLQSAKKILNRRIAELELSKNASTRLNDNPKTF